MIRQAEAGARALDGLRDEVHGLVLAEDDALERLLERPQALAVGRRRLPVGDARHARDDALDVGDVDDGRGVARGLAAGCAAALRAPCSGATARVPARPASAAPWHVLRLDRGARRRSDPEHRARPRR